MARFRVGRIFILSRASRDILPSAIATPLSSSPVGMPVEPRSNELRKSGVMLAMMPRAPRIDRKTNPVYQNPLNVAERERE
jgi:hypothetical protein